jgi:hypothetical protein
MPRSRDAFALVELLVGLVALAIVAALVVVVVNSVGYDAGAEACRKEALEFESAVNRFYERHEPHTWPPAGKDNSVAQVAQALSVRGDLQTSPAEALAHLDGSQRTLPTADKGWRYNFDAHTTDDTGC